MAFEKDQLLLSADKAAQLTKALANVGVDDPLQYLCDEAAADVARMTASYLVDDVSLRTFIRGLALFRCYSKAGTGVPDDVKEDYDAAMKELEAIAQGKRPNLPKVEDPALSSAAGKAGSQVRIKGRMETDP